MTKRTRRAVLYSLIALFFIIGTAAIFYAQGWRAELRPFAVEKVGGIYARVTPGDAEVKLDGTPVRRLARIFERGTLVNNLFPGFYTLTVTKDGYRDWTATIPVAPSYVTSHSYIVLVPSKGEVATSTPISALAQIGPDNFALTTASQQVFFHNNLMAGDTIVAGSEDGRVLLTRSSKTGALYLGDQSTATSTNLGRAYPRFASYLSDPSLQAVFIPQNDTLFLIHTSSSLRLANTVTGRTTLLSDIPVSPGATAVDASRVAWTTFDPLSGRSTLSVYDLLSDTLSKNIDLAPGATKKMSFLGRSTALLLQKDNALYSFSLNENVRSKLADDVFDFSIAPDESAMALLERDGIQIISERDTNRSAFFRIPDPGTVSRIAWYGDNGHHLFLNYPDRIVFLDLADATLQNLITVTSGTAFAYLPGPNQLYALSSTTLRRFQFP
jgi:hypothetical protein